MKFLLYALLILVIIPFGLRIVLRLIDLLLWVPQKLATLVNRRSSSHSRPRSRAVFTRSLHGKPAMACSGRRMTSFGEIFPAASMYKVVIARP